jgi:hypothetical protein
MEPFMVPRSEMPQLDHGDVKAFLAFARAGGVAVERVTVAPGDVKPHQLVAWDPARPPNMHALGRPIMISAESLILDGHHRWNVAHRVGADLDAYRLGLEWPRAVAFLFSFPKVHTSQEAYS